MHTMAKLAHDNMLTLRVPADDFEVNLYKQVIGATVAKWESEWLYGAIGDYNGDGTWSFAAMLPVSQVEGGVWKMFSNGKSVHGKIAVYAAGERVQVVWEVASDEPGELDSQSNYGEYPPVVSWTVAAASTASKEAN